MLLVIGATMTLLEISLPTLLEIITAGRVFVISLPVVGSRLTQ